MEKTNMKSMDKVMTVRQWDETGAYGDMEIYATVHEVDGTVMFIEPFAVMTGNDGKVYRHYYNREKMNADIEILEMSEF